MIDYLFVTTSILLESAPLKRYLHTHFSDVALLPMLLPEKFGFNHLHLRFKYLKLVCVKN